MTVKLTSNKAAAVTDDLAFIVRNAIAYIKVLEAELARCKQVCAATSEAWREEAALAEPVPGQGCDHCKHPLYAAIKCRVCGRQTQAEPVQEPVAWRWGYRSITTGEMDWRGYVEIAADPNLRSPAIIMQPLYAAAPQRKPLTDDEIKKLLIEHAGMTVVFSEVDLRFARAIERAHGIGGQP